MAPRHGEISQLETVHSHVVTPGGRFGRNSIVVSRKARPSQVQIRNGPGSDSSCKPSAVPSLEAPVRILSRVRPLCGASQAGTTLPFSTMRCTNVGTSSALALRHCTNLRALRPPEQARCTTLSAITTLLQGHSQG